MEATNKSTLPSNGSVRCEDFEPNTVWEKEEAQDTLIFHLPGFKKEELRVQINNHGVLKVSGECGNESKRRRFFKELRIPKDGIANEVRAKFSGGQLHIIMPKKVSTPVAPTPTTMTTPAPVQPLPPSQQSLQNEQPKQESSGRDETIKEQEGSGVVLRNSVSRLKVDKKTVVGVTAVVAVATGIAVGAYFTYKFWHSHPQPEWV